MNQFCKEINSKTQNKHNVINLEYSNGFIYWTATGQHRTLIPNFEGVKEELIDDFHRRVRLGANKVYTSL